MSYEQFLNLSIGTKIIDKRGITYKVAWKRNKDNWALTKGTGVMYACIHKDNYKDYNLKI